jgi:hypothetical protein
VNLAGTAPEFAFSYVPPGGNQSNISSGGKITFPVTAIDGTSIATFVLTNRGAGQGLVNMISLDNTNFQLAGVPLPNSYLDAGKDLRFSVTFTAHQTDPVTGNLVVDLPTGRFVFGLEGSGSGPVFSYTAVADSTVTSLLPGQLVTLPDATLGDKSSIVIRVENDGNADGRITAISASGTGFTVSDAPFLPFTLTAGSSVNVTVTFTPTQSGKSTGRVRIGSDSFELAATGIGPVLAFSYTVGTTTTTIQNGGSVIFTPVAVGKSVAAQFVVANNGTAPTSVSSISVSGATPASTNPIFTVTGLPPVLPTSIASGGSIVFTVTFVPSTTGAASATLKVDTQSFTLSASANPPPALPDYRFDGASGTQAPLTQPLVGLLLSQSYPINLTGTLTLGFNSEVGVTDPSVQFAVGGKTVSFTIPANTTRAIFSNGAQQVKVQTGSVAGAITLTPSFITDGGINLTPANPPFQSLPIVQSAPVLGSLQLAAKTTTSFTIQATGYATGRSVTQIDVQLTPASGENVQTTKVSISAEPSFLAWYASSASQQYGSLFTVTIPFTVAGDVKNVTNVVDTIQSVSVTLTNRQGTSPAMTLSLK